MGKNELQKGFGGLLSTIMSQINDSDVTEVSYKIDKRKGIMNISGKKNDESFRATQRFYGDNGMVQTAARFKQNMSRPERVNVVKQLRREGYKQQEIADMLGISQAQVSNILNS